MAGAAGSLDSTPSFLKPAKVVNQEDAEARLDVSREEFFQLLIAEIRSQDPLEPMSNQQFLGQLAQLEMLNSQNKMTDGIGELTSALGFSQLNQASSLLGKVIVGEVRQQAVDAEGVPRFDIDNNPIYENTEVIGLAESVSKQGNEYFVNLLVPVIGSDGQPATDAQGNIITREQTVGLATVKAVRDPYINGDTVEAEADTGAGAVATP